MRQTEFYTKLFYQVRDEHKISCTTKPASSGCGSADISWRTVHVPRMTNLHNFLIGLHEIAHVIQGNIKPRYAEEYWATIWAIKTAKSMGLTIPQDEINHWRRCISYSISKAVNRGLLRIDPEIRQWVENKTHEDVPG